MRSRNQGGNRGDDESRRPHCLGLGSSWRATRSTHTSDQAAGRSPGERLNDSHRGAGLLYAPSTDSISCSCAAPGCRALGRRGAGPIEKSLRSCKGRAKAPAASEPAPCEQAQGKVRRGVRRIVVRTPSSRLWISSAASIGRSSSLLRSNERALPRSRSNHAGSRQISVRDHQ